MLRRKKFVGLLITWYSMGTLIAARRDAAFVRGDDETEMFRQFRWKQKEILFLVSYLQNLLTDTKIEQVDTQDCSELEYVLVMRHHWPILSVCPSRGTLHSRILVLLRCTSIEQLKTSTSKAAEHSSLLSLFINYESTDNDNDANVV